MGDSFRLYYLFRGEEKTKDFDSWMEVLLFIDETENIQGGYIYLIELNGEATYIKILDHENGSDSWVKISGEEVQLEQEFRSRV